MSVFGVRTDYRRNLFYFTHMKDNAKYNIQRIYKFTKIALDYMADIQMTKHNITFS